MKKEFSTYVKYIAQISQLKKMELFKDVVNLASLVKIASVLEVVEYPPGAVLFREGDFSDSLFLIESGQIMIMNSEGVQIALVGPGECIGELGLIESKMRSATAISKDVSKLLVISQLDFNYLIALDPEIAKSLLVIISRRIRLMLEKG